MPRRPAIVIPKIPLFLLGPVVGREAKKAGETLVRIVITEMKGHFFSISVHTRAMCRSVFRYKPRLPDTGTWPGPSGSPAGVTTP